MIEQRKQAVSIRIGESDLRNLKRVATRLGVRDSDIIRYAIKSMLARISPLCDKTISGRNLVPVLIESGDELIRYFELDAYQLDRIINDNAEADEKVHRDDIALLTMSGLREQYLRIRLNDRLDGNPETQSPARSLRNYLYDKYVYRNPELRDIPPAPQPAAHSPTPSSNQPPAPQPTA